MLLFHRRALCNTPKRCCSSITTNPSEWNLTPSSMSAWVPMRIWSVPASSSACITSRSFLRVDPVSRRTFIPNGAASFRNVSKCCVARISVGAIRHACVPLSSAMSIAMSATIVFPEPTSPCSRRFICLPEPTSALISFNTRFCASVSGHGSTSE